MISTSGKKLPPHLARIAALPKLQMPPKKKTRKPAKKTDKAGELAKSLGVSEEELQRMNAAQIGKQLRVFEKELAKSVKHDRKHGWHDQGETMQLWFHELKPLLQSVADVGIIQGQAFQQCHTILSNISDSFAAMSRPDARITLDDMLHSCKAEVDLGPADGERVTIVMGHYSETPVEAACSFLWRYLLRTAAASEYIDDATVLRMADTASGGYKVSLLSGWEDEDENVHAEGADAFSFPGMPPVEPLAALLARDKAAKEAAEEAE